MTEVGFGGLAVSLVLVAVAIGVSLWQRLGVERAVAWATVRAVVQLLAIGLILGLVIDPAAPLAWAWIWVAVMVVFAAATIRRRAPEVPALFPVALSALAAAAVVTLGVIFGLGIFSLEARALVPLAGMMVGNSMNGTVLAARRVVEELADHRLELEARLALGMDSRTAARPYVRSALRTALTPQIETTKAVGLVFLPGAMTGLILAGVDPLEAVIIQAAIMFLVLGSVAITASVVAVGVSKRLFTPDHRPVRLLRKAD